MTEDAAEYLLAAREDPRSVAAALRELDELNEQIEWDYDAMFSDVETD